MSGLGKTVADLVARARSTIGDERPSPLEEVTGFGDNPGALRMWAHSPEGVAASPALVVVLHGCGQTAAGYVEDSGWLELADRYGFVVLCPEQVRSNNLNRCFNWFEPHDTARGCGEAASIASMILRAVADQRIDPERVFITGLSAGGAMAAVMLAAYPELFAAGSIIAGLPYGAAASVPEALAAMKAVPLLSGRAWGDKVRRASSTALRWPKVAIWHGDADTTVAMGAADALVAQWTDVHELGQGQETEAAPSRHRLVRWRDASGAVVVEAHRIAGLGHGVPIAAAGEDGCGAAAPWVLEAGVSSSLEMARAWDLARVRRTTASRRPKPAPPSAARPSSGLRNQGVDVTAVVSGAMRGAGLLR